MHQTVRADAGAHIDAGTSLGSGCVKFLTGHDSVRVDGIPVVRHGSECMVNCNAAGEGGAKGKVVTEISSWSREAFLAWANKWSAELYVPPGAVTNTYNAAAQGVLNANNTWAERGIYALFTAASVLGAGMEETGRGIMNIPSAALGAFQQASDAGEEIGMATDASLDPDARILAFLAATASLADAAGALVPTTPEKPKPNLRTAAGKVEAVAAAGVHVKPRLRTLKELEGKSEGGPGKWEKSPKRTGGEEFQEQVTGVERGTEYTVDGVRFDGWDSKRGVLQDAKDWEKFPPLDQKFWEKKTLEQAERQLGAVAATAPGTPIEWVFSTQNGADAAAALLSDRGISGITTVVTPKY